MQPTFKYLRDHALAAAALACSILALATSSYAAFRIPDRSVGAAQLRDHAIDPAKFNPNTIAASISAWVETGWNGRQLVAEASSDHVTVLTTAHHAAITWPTRRFAKDCIPSVTPRVNIGAPHRDPPIIKGGFVTARFDPNRAGGAFLYLKGFDPSGVDQPPAAYVLIVCPSGGASP